MTRTPNPADDVRSDGAGSLADMVAESDRAPRAGRAYGQAAIQIGVLATLLAVLNFWQFRILWTAWRNDPNWSHGFIIPLFSLFLLYNRRQELLNARPRPFAWALPMLILALAAQMIAFHPIGTDWLCQLGMVAVLFFLVLYVAGPSVIAITWLPILYLALAMPVPATLYARVSEPLQEVAAQGSALILRACGVEIQVTASHLSMLSRSGVWQEVTVAEACSGMRSLMAYVALGVAWAYLENRPVWQRIVLVLAIIPVAVLCNVIRVAITCTAYVYDQPELGQKFMHTFTGMLMLIPALLMFLCLSWLLKRLFVEQEAEDSGGGGEPRPAGQEGPK